jgi:hypothetical protein
MNRIGFNLSRNSDGTTDAEAPLIDSDTFEDMVMGLFNPPPWQIELEHTLFWATLFNTQHKVNEC